MRKAIKYDNSILNERPLIPAKDKVVLPTKQLTALKEAVKLERKEHLDYIQCDRNEGNKYKAARDAVDKLLEEQ